MTENESAIETLTFYKNERTFNSEDEKALDYAIKSLEEIQRYRALGTVKELNYKISHYVMYEKLVEKYREIGTPEELREAMEKQMAKKPKTILRHHGGFETEHCPNCDTDYQVDQRYVINDDYCPACGKLLDSGFKNFCGNCGQAIGWDQEDT